MVAGAVNLLGATLLYSIFLRAAGAVRRWHQAFQSRLYHWQNKGESWQAKWFVWMMDLQWRILQSSAYRRFNIGFALALMVGGVLWLALRP
jgi:hypothetical protein